MKPDHRRFRWRPLAASLAVTGGVLAVSLLVSCNGKRQPPPSESVAPPSPARPAAPLLEDWPDPQAVLVFSGDEQGYLEPCGCSERQSGGLARRGDLLRQLREERNWAATGFHVGGTLYEPRVGYPQSQIKFSIMMKGLNELGYQGLALGQEELMLGPQNVYTAHLTAESQEEFDLPFLAANVTLFGTRDLGTPHSYRIVETGGVKIAVTAVVGESTRRKLAATGLTQDQDVLRIDEPSSVLAQVLEELQAEKPDLLVLLSHSEMQESRELAAAFPDFDVVVTSGSPEDPRREPEWIGETLFIQVGKKGKHAAVVGVFPGNRLRMELIELDMDRFGNLPAMMELMREYQDRLKEAWPELSADFVSDPPHGSFVGAQECKSCHTFAYSVWEKSRHAHAYQSLEKGHHKAHEDEDVYSISRIHDPECLACHVTGWDPQKALRHESGFVDFMNTPHLAGQQCENCHGPGSRHVALEKELRERGTLSEAVVSARKSMQLTITRARNNVCIRCHDHDNSPNFDFEEYMRKINHSGRKD